MNKIIQPFIENHPTIAAILAGWITWIILAITAFVFDLTSNSKELSIAVGAGIIVKDFIN